MSYLKKDTVLDACPSRNRVAVEDSLTIVSAEAIHAKATRDAVLATRPRRNGDNGRSQWFSFTLSNGDVIFGCFPQGDTLAAVQADSQA